jgi:hypothetical protein
MVNAGGGQQLGLDGDYPSGGPLVYFFLVPVAIVALAGLSLGFVRFAEALGVWSLPFVLVVLVAVAIEVRFDVTATLDWGTALGLPGRIVLAIALFTTTLFAGIALFLDIPWLVRLLIGPTAAHAFLGTLLSVLAVPIPIGVILFGAVRSLSLVRG